MPYARLLGPDSCQDLPSVVMEGAMTISALWNSRTVEAPQKPIAVLMAPTKFWVPLVTEVGPNRICCSQTVVPTLMRVPRGRTGLGVDIPQ